MSSISLNGASSVLYPQLSANNTDPLLAPNSSAPSAALESTLSQSDNGSLASTSHRPHQHSELFHQVQKAVTSTLQSAQANNSANANQLIEQAITNLIQNTLSQSTSPASTDSDGDSQNTGTSTTGSSAASSTNSQSAFFQALESNGVNPQQFRSDFLAAIQQAQQTGTANPSTVFSAFPPGLSVDTAA
jgi:hypothetical protein